MPSLKIGYYNSPGWRPYVSERGVIFFTVRVFLCHSCAVALGALRQEADGTWRTVEEGKVANVRWASKGYDCGLSDDYQCLCGEKINGGEEINLSVDAAP